MQLISNATGRRAKETKLWRDGVADRMWGQYYSYVSSLRRRQTAESRALRSRTHGQRPGRAGDTSSTSPIVIAKFIGSSLFLLLLHNCQSSINCAVAGTEQGPEALAYGMSTSPVRGSTSAGRKSMRLHSGMLISHAW